MADEAKPRGRRGAGEQLEPMTIRIPPKVRFGLDLLARLQGRSLTQAVEWALQNALTNARAVELKDGEKSASLWMVLNVAWDYEGWRRTYSLYGFNPMLVPFEERYACRLIERSLEQRTLDNMLSHGVISQEHMELSEKWAFIVQRMWPDLVADVDDETIRGLDKRPLAELAGLTFYDHKDLKTYIRSVFDDLNAPSDEELGIKPD